MFKHDIVKRILPYALGATIGLGSLGCQEEPEINRNQLMPRATTTQIPTQGVKMEFSLGPEAKANSNSVEKESQEDTAQQGNSEYKSLDHKIFYEGKIKPFYVWSESNVDDNGYTWINSQKVQTEQRVGGKETGIPMDNFKTQVLPVDVLDAYKVLLADKNGIPLANFDGKNGIRVYAYNEGNWFNDGEADSTEIAKELDGRGTLRYAVELWENGKRIDSVEGNLFINSVDGTPYNVKNLESKIGKEEIKTEIPEPTVATQIPETNLKEKPSTAPHVYLEGGSAIGELNGEYIGAGFYPQEKIGFGVRAGKLEGSLEQQITNYNETFDTGHRHVKKETVNHLLDTEYIAAVINYRPTQKFGLQFMAGRMNGDDKQTRNRFSATYDENNELIADNRNPINEDNYLGEFDTSASIYGAGIEFKFGGSVGIAAQGGINYVDHKNEKLEDTTIFYAGLKGEF